MAYGFLPIGVMLATAFLIPIASLKSDRHAKHVATAGMILSLILTATMVPEIFSSGRLVFQIEGWPAPFGISIVLDTLSITLVFLSILVSLLVVVFSYKYVKERRTKYYSLISLSLVGTLGMLVAGDLFNMFVYLEVLSVSSYALVAFNKDRPAIESGIKYLIIGSLGTSLVLLGVSFLYGLTGSLNLADIAIKLLSVPGAAAGLAIGLIISGMAVKAGLMPFHAWLPDSYQSSPSPISAIFSGVTANAGIYAIMRIGFISLMSHQALLGLLLFFGLLSMVAGAFLALVQSNLKRLLGYSSISQMGYIAMSIALGTPFGVSAGMLHMINQAFIKGLLFLSTAFIVYRTKTDNIYEISGNFRFHPVVAYSFLIGSLSLVGVPLFNGFVSKWMIYMATLEVSPVLTVISLMVTVITLAYILKAFYLIFLGNAKPDPDAGILPLSMKIPIIILSAIIVAMGIFPELSIKLSVMMFSDLDRFAYIGDVLK